MNTKLRYVAEVTLIAALLGNSLFMTYVFMQLFLHSSVTLYEFNRVIVSLEFPFSVLLSSSTIALIIYKISRINKK